MIITLKDRDSVWIAINTNTTRTHVEDALLAENLPIFRAPNTKTGIIAATGSVGSDVDYLRYCNELALSHPLTRNSILLKTIPAIKSICQRYEMTANGESVRELVIAKDDRAFIILPSFTCYEIEDFYVTGNGEDIAHGAMLYYKDLPPVERISESFRVLEKTRRNKHFPIVIMNTMQKDRIVIET